MRVTKTSDGKLFVGVLLKGGGIRWNATFYLIERALKCRPAIDLYQAQWKPPDKTDKHKDGKGSEGGQGSVWQVLYAMDLLLTDRSPIYRMAIALHPAYQFEYFQEKWWKRGDWIKAAERDLTLHYGRFAAVTVATEYVDRGDNTSFLTDDRRRVRRLGPHNRSATPWQEEKVWWVDRRHTWPILSKLALNVFSTPAMSAEPERVFSDGSELITDKRNGLGDDMVEAEMIQKSWNTSKVLRGMAAPRGVLYELSD
ncbi:hypothetical protein V2A60_002430 [Cordyceps javanica]